MGSAPVVRARSPIALTLSLLVGACHPRAPAPPRDAPAPSRDAAAPRADRPADASAARPPSAELADLDARIRAREAAIVRNDDWLSWERVAVDYMTRARMSSDYADYARAEQSLARSFAHASPGTGPFLTRARFNYTVHRVGRVTADLDALQYAILRFNERESVAHLRAEVAFYSGRYDEAERRYAANLAAERGVTNLVAMAQFQWKTNAFDEAERTLAEADAAAAREDDGMRAWVFLVRGMMELDRGRWDAALAAFRGGLRLQPTSWMFQEHVAEVLMFLGHDEEARLMYVDLVERTGDPEFVDCLAQIYERRGDAAQARPVVARARAAYEERLRVMPEATAGHAIEFFLRRDPARAVPIAELNRDARPNGEALVKLAEAYLNVGRVDDARRVIDALLATRWRTADAHAAAARVYARSGDGARAAVERRAALAIDPHALDDEPDAGR